MQIQGAITTQVDAIETNHDLLESWHDIDWKKGNGLVVKLRRRMSLASKQGKSKRLRKLQRLIVGSKSNILYSIRKVTSNSGKDTPGIDYITYSTPKEKLEVFKELCSFDFKGYQSIPTKRIYVPKPDGRLRPIGIPTVKDRILQQIVKNALEPEWESKFESCSYGFRPSRGVNDAVNRIFVSINKPNCRPWVLDLDIKGCFDNISHGYLLDKLDHFPYIHMVEEWLRAGILHDGIFYDTNFGTPQGSIISPFLCNIALDGIEKEIGVKVSSKGYNKQGSRSLIRYADDMIILCYSKQDVIKAKNEIIIILDRRGLKVSELKTRELHICEGFDFVGFSFRIEPKDGFLREDVIYQAGEDFRYLYDKTLCLLRPSGKSIRNIRAKLKEVFTAGRGTKASSLIMKLNPIIRGWANSKINWHSNRTFHDLDHYVFTLCVRWMKRRHPNKGWKWLIATYFKHKNDPPFNNK